MHAFLPVRQRVQPGPLICVTADKAELVSAPINVNNCRVLVYVRLMDRLAGVAELHLTADSTTYTVPLSVPPQPPPPSAVGSSNKGHAGNGRGRLLTAAHLSVQG